MSAFIWGQGNVIWSNNEFRWGITVEVTAEVLPTTGYRGFVDLRKKKHTHRWKLQNDQKTEYEEQGKRYIKLTCIIDDEMFEEEKYIGKIINVESFDEELLITDIKRINVSVNEIITK